MFSLASLRMALSEALTDDHSVGRLIRCGVRSIQIFNESYNWKTKTKMVGAGILATTICWTALKQRPISRSTSMLITFSLISPDIINLYCASRSQSVFSKETSGLLQMQLRERVQDLDQTTKQSQPAFSEECTDLLQMETQKISQNSEQVTQPSQLDSLDEVVDPPQIKDQTQEQRISQDLDQTTRQSQSNSSAEFADLIHIQEPTQYSAKEQVLAVVREYKEIDSLSKQIAKKQKHLLQTRASILDEIQSLGIRSTPLQKQGILNPTPLQKQGILNPTPFRQRRALDQIITQKRKFLRLNQVYVDANQRVNKRIKDACEKIQTLQCAIQLEGLSK